MDEIKEIYKGEYMRGHFTYAGTLRNEFKFNLDDDVFFVIRDNQIARGRVIGVEKTISDNPDYLYKITIPSEFLRQQMEKLGVGFHEFQDIKDFKGTTLKCDRIFKTIEEAKESAIKQTNHLYKLQKEEIERYFKQFEK